MPKIELLLQCKFTDSNSRHKFYHLFWLWISKHSWMERQTAKGFHKKCTWGGKDMVISITCWQIVLFRHGRCYFFLIRAPLKRRTVWNCQTIHFKLVMSKKVRSYFGPALYCWLYGMLIWNPPLKAASVIFLKRTLKIWATFSWMAVWKPALCDYPWFFNY